MRKHIVLMGRDAENMSWDAENRILLICQTTDLGGKPSGQTSDL